MISIGCTRADPTSPARKLWDTLARRTPGDYQFWNKIRFWACVLNPAAIAAAGFTFFERWGPLALRILPWPRFQQHPDPQVRRYQPSDLPDCLQMIEVQASSADCRMLWTATRLEAQLGGSGFSRTLILTDGDSSVAFLNYYVIRWSGAREIRVGIIDLFAGRGSWLLQRRLLKSAQRQMREEGLELALMMNSIASPSSVLLSRGFVPIDGEADQFGLLIDPRLQLPPLKRFHILLT
jgi:hypothetical protein